MDLRARHHGRAGPHVVVVHGGPGAPGSAAGLARGLADSFRVLEPWQRGSGPEPLTVARHVADLHAAIESIGSDSPPAVVGHSWGAMLALACAAEHPRSVGPLVLVGCGTFDRGSRERLEATLQERIEAELRSRLRDLSVANLDPHTRSRRRLELVRSLYEFRPIERSPQDEDLELFDERAFQETWTDMVRLQEERVYPESFSRIESPVLMLHGAHDPHPGAMIRASLEPHLPQLSYREWERCGHEPWNEAEAREAFFGVLRSWLLNSR